VRAATGDGPGGSHAGALQSAAPPATAAAAAAQRSVQGPGGAYGEKAGGQRARAEHYPAPYAIIDIWARHHGNALAAPQLIDSIVRSPTARNLVRVFFMQERLKSLGKGVRSRPNACMSSAPA
jgi:hypothetical protein